MANLEHLKILKKGVDVWNKWRAENIETNPDISNADLRRINLIDAILVRANATGSDFAEAQLQGAHFGGAEFYKANLIGASLSSALLIATDFAGANISEAVLWDADLTNANLNDASLKYSKLDDVRFKGTKLENTEFSEVILNNTIFSNVDLSKAKGLDSVWHEGPSTIGIDTIFKSKGKIPESFLKGAGVPEIFITYMHSLVDENPIEFYTCFLSYGEPDRAFVDRLHADLQAKGIRVWYWHEDHTMGAITWKEIHQKIRLYDKLMVVCSKEALNRDTVIKEIERALQKETKEGIEILFPIRLDDYVLKEWDHYLEPELTKRNIGDFRNWDKDHDKYQKELKRLMKGLGKKE